MKRVLGIGVTLMGLMFLIRPDFNLQNMVESLGYLFYKYWSLLLISYGIFLQTGSKKKRRR